MKHTKGPWRARCMGSEGSIVWMDGKDEKQHPRIGMVASCTMRPFDESNANALLIASAPELLEACKEIIMVIDNEGIARGKYYGKAINMAEQAIAKAEGKE